MSNKSATRQKTATVQDGEALPTRALSNRHIQPWAIGGALGTGLFVGSGKTISVARPSVIFVFMIIGFMLFLVMRAMGQMLLSNLEYKSFSDFAGDLLAPGRVPAARTPRFASACFALASSQAASAPRHFAPSSVIS